MEVVCVSSAGRDCDSQDHCGIALRSILEADLTTGGNHDFLDGGGNEGRGFSPDRERLLTFGEPRCHMVNVLLFLRYAVALLLKN